MTISPTSDGPRPPLIERSDAVKAIVWVIVAINLFAAALAVRLWRTPPVPAEPLRFVTDVNTAPASELALLPGIGVELAKRIVVDRTTHGGYRSAEDLQRVPGIGPKTVDQIGPLVTFSGPDPAAPSDDRDRR